MNATDFQIRAYVKQTNALNWIENKICKKFLFPSLIFIYFCLLDGVFFSLSFSISLIDCHLSVCLLWIHKMPLKRNLDFMFESLFFVIFFGNFYPKKEFKKKIKACSYTHYTVAFLCFYCIYCLIIDFCICHLIFFSISIVPLRHFRQILLYFFLYSIEIHTLYLDIFDLFTPLIINYIWYKSIVFFFNEKKKK